MLDDVMEPSASESARAARIQAALDKLVAQGKRDRAGGLVSPGAPALSSSAFSPSPAGSPRSPRLKLLVCVGLAAAGLQAGALYWYAEAVTRRLDAAPAFQPLPRPPIRHAASPLIVPASPDPAPVEAPAIPARSGRDGVIAYGDKVIVVPSSPPAPRDAVRPTIAVPIAPASVRPAPSPAPAAVAPAAPARPSKDDHARAAKDHAYQHFRYKYKVGSGNYAVTSLNIALRDTEEVPSWNRHRTTGEAGLEYYDGSGFRRTTRRFEVLTETHEGRVRAIDLTVKW